MSRTRTAVLTQHMICCEVSGKPPDAAKCRGILGYALSGQFGFRSPEKPEQFAPGFLRPSLFIGRNSNVANILDHRTH